MAHHVSTAAQGEQKNNFLLNFGSRGAWGPRGAILWGTPRMQKAVPHLGVDENVKLARNGLGSIEIQHDLVKIDRNFGANPAMTCRDDGNAPGP